MDMQHFLIPFTITYSEVRCAATPLWSSDKEGSLNFLILPGGFTAWSSVKIYSQYSCVRWSLNSLFTTIFSTCICEVIPPGSTTGSVLMELPVIVAYFPSVKCPLNVSRTSIPCFLRGIPGFCSTPLTTNPSYVHCHPTFRLPSDNDSSRQLLLRHCSAI